MVELNGKKILVTFLMHLGDLTLTPRPTATSPCWWMKS